MFEQSAEAWIVEVDTVQQLSGLSAAIRQQLSRNPTHPPGVQKFAAHRHRQGCAVLVVNDFEVGARGKSEAHGQAGKRINAFGIAWRDVRQGTGVHNDPCRKVLATSLG